MDMNLQIMFIKFIITISVIALLHFEGAPGQTIELYEYNQEESVTNCTHGLISDVDTVVFKAKVDNSEDTNVRHVYFRIKQKDESTFWTFILINLKKCGAAEHYTCEQIDTHVVLITIRIKAEKKLSGAKIIGVLVTSKKEINSDQQVFPEIADATDMTGTLLINGVEVQKTSNVYFSHNKDNVTYFRFECESKVLPCLIEISADALLKPVQGKNSIHFIFQNVQLNITLKKALCTLDRKNETTYNIFINGSQSESDYGSGADEEMNLQIVWLLPLLTSAIICTTCFILIGYLIYRKTIGFEGCCHFPICFTYKKNVRFSKTCKKKPNCGEKGSMLNVGASTSATDINSGVTNDKTHSTELTVEINETSKREKESNTLIYTKVPQTSEDKYGFHHIKKEKFLKKVENNLEMEATFYEEKINLEDEDQWMASLETKEAILDKNGSDILFYVMGVLNGDNHFKKKTLEIRPMPDDDFPFTETNIRLLYYISDNLYLRAYLFKEVETNAKCTCHKCKELPNPSTEWVQLSFIQNSLDKNITIDLSKSRDTKRGNIHLKREFEEDKQKNVSVLELVTCDKILTERIDRDLRDWSDKWSTINKKKRKLSAKFNCA